MTSDVVTQIHSQTFTSRETTPIRIVQGTQYEFSTLSWRKTVSSRVVPEPRKWLASQKSCLTVRFDHGGKRLVSPAQAVKTDLMGSLLVC